MKERIKFIISDLNIKNGDFAAKINVSPGSVSQWLSGRQKPKIENIDKILSEFPRYSRSWLLNGVEPIHVNSSVKSNNTASEPSLFDDLNTEDNYKEIKAIPEDKSEIKLLNEPPIDSKLNYIPNKKEKVKKEITKIVFFYSDNSFEIFENNIE